MYLEEVTIRNFRGIQELTIPFSKDTTVIIGENNVGKTSILEAIRLGMKLPGSGMSFDPYDYRVEPGRVHEHQAVEICIEFTYALPEESPVYNTKFEGIIQFTPEQKIFLRVKSLYNHHKREYALTVKFLNHDRQELNDEEFQKDNKLHELYTTIPSFFLSALRDIREQLHINSPIWGGVLRGIIPNAESMLEIHKDIKNMNESIVRLDPGLEKIKAKLETLKKILNLGKEHDVVFRAIPLHPWELISNLKLVLTDSNEDVEMPLQRHGQGTQSMAVLLLLQAYMQLIAPDNKENLALLALEEPEANLYPHAIRSLKHQIKQMKCQKIITTHSPYFVQIADPSELRLLRRVNNQTVVKFIRDEVVSELNGDVLHEKIKSHADGMPQMMSVDRYLWNTRITYKAPMSVSEKRDLMVLCGQENTGAIEKLFWDSQLLFTKKERQDISSYVQRFRGEILFARAWLLAEGQSESIVLPTFAEIMGKNLDEHGISLIDFRNNGKAGLFVKLAKVLGFPWILLNDKDEQGRNTEEEILKVYKKDEVVDLIIEYPGVCKDFEEYLGNNGFIDYMEEIIREKGIYCIQSDHESDDEYGKRVITLYQKHKVEYAYRFKELLIEKQCDVSRIPDKIKFIIERSVELANGK
ncbi:AAA family ATPase [Paenibacillus sp. SZ31]|uniref:AAA family ATPase n=1 Tax=Paenibacillus sp. SZ31 TaxID=2725555 RepID=UPI00146CB8A5|nr:AAA family ATPase [Paenibacillus sp. SZ31]NMI06946.1 AAA family ATPase [Paenibacillus sp. SZ31]